MSCGKGSGWAISDSSDDDLPTISCTNKKVMPSGKKYAALNLSDSSSNNENPCEYITLSQRISEVPKQKASISNKIGDGTVPNQTARITNSFSNKLSKDVARNKNDEKKAAKEQKRAEILKRKATQAELKSLKPEECLKRMVCQVDSSISHIFNTDQLIAMLNQDSDAKFEVFCDSFPCVRWKRCLTFYQANEEQSLTGVETVQDEPELLAILPQQEFVSLVRGHRNDTSNSLPQWACEIAAQNPSYAVHLVCIGVEAYKRKVKNKANREYRKLVAGSSESNGKPSKKTKKDKLVDVSSQDIEDALVMLQINSGINVIFVETVEEFVLLVQQMTKSVAEAPYKRMKRQNVQFINEKSSVKVDARTGDGSKKVWKQMLLQFHNVSPDMANAIAAKYPSLGSLLRTYCRLSSVDGEKLLSDIVVRRGVGTLESQRRIGPELSRRLHRMLTTLDGEQVLF